ncbi:MAG: helix-turn-helix domain-containing protein [Treponema sp.]
MNKATEYKTITIKLYKGVTLEFYDTETDETYALRGKPRNVFRIDYCKQGILEGEFENKSFSYLGEQETAINYEKLALLKTYFPLRIYKGVSILFFLDELDEKFTAETNAFGIDINKICTKLDLKNGWYKLKPKSEITEILDTLYGKIALHDHTYFQIKTLEILHYLDKLNTAAYRTAEFFSGYNIKKVKKIHTFIIENLDKNISFQQLVKAEGISYTIFQKLFKQIYGDSPYAYLKKYKLKTGAFYISSTNKKITDIASDLGYANASKFSDAFKAIYGKTPLHYRKSFTEPT